MPVVRIEHPVADYDAWKQAFDSDPMVASRSACAGTGSCGRRATTVAPT